MPRIGCSGMLLLGLGLIVIVLVGIVLFPVPRPHVALKADAIFHVHGFPITNTLLASWLSILVLVALFVAATRKMKLVPTGLQNLVETVIEMLLSFVVGIAGEKNGRRFFPVIATIFLFVIVNAWLAMVPGFHTIGFGEHETYQGAFAGSANGLIIEKPLLKKASTDANFPLAIALFTGLFGWFWGLRLSGFRRFLGEFLRIGGLIAAMKQIAKGKVGSGIAALLPGFIDIFIGFIEFLSHLIRVVSFTFRLFGNMTAGEVLIMIIAFLVPWAAAAAFYGLELILGFVQALIFAGLTLVWTSMVATHEEEH